MTSPAKRALWSDWLSLYGATLVAQAISGFRSIAVAGLLGPQQFGLWKSIQLVLSYSAWIDGGATRALGRQLPLLRGQGRAGESAAVERTGWAMVLGPASLAGLILLAFAAAVGGNPLRRSLMAFAPVLITARALAYLLEVSNARKEFALKSRAIIGLAAADAVLAPLASWFGGVDLFMASLAATNTLAAAYLALGLSFDWRPRCRLTEMRAIAGVGFPVALSVLAYESAKSVDRFVLAAFVGTEAVGYYGLAVIVFELALMVPTVIGHVLLPNVVEQYGRDGDGELLFRRIERVTKIIATLFPAALALGWVLLPLGTEWVLPAYLPGVGAARTLMWGTLFLSAHVCASIVLITVRRVGCLMFAQVLAAALGAVLCIGAVRNGLGVTGVAGAMLIAYAVSSTVEFCAAALCCGQPLRRALRALGGAYVSGVLVVCALVFGERMLAEQTGAALVAWVTLGLGGLGLAMAWRWRRIAEAGADCGEAGASAGAVGAGLRASPSTASFCASEGACDVEDADWRFLLPFSPTTRSLWLGARAPASLALTAPHRLLVVDYLPADGRPCPATSGVRLLPSDLPFASASFEIVAIDLAANGLSIQALPTTLAEARRVLARDGYMHVAVPGWSADAAGAGGLRQLPRLAVAAVRAWARGRNVRRAIQAAGFERMRCYLRLPAHSAPRYLLDSEDALSLDFILWAMPTATQRAGSVLSAGARAALWQCLRLLRACRLSLATAAPGLSVVARRPS